MGVRFSPGAPGIKKMAPRNNNILIGGALVYKEGRGKRFYWLIATEEGEWEIAKVTVRRGESSPRSVIRMTGEQAGMNARILEEVGRNSGVVVVNGKAVAQKIFYYLMLLKSAGETFGFAKTQWFDYGKAIKAISLKREKDVLKNAESMVKEWEKEKKRKK
jgi:hypothetical protein